uniref:Uncharacterized protein n=1 Tax=Rhodnius prolixus TaxID=13249 RepID=T1HCM1_RHOPR
MKLMKPVLLYLPNVLVKGCCLHQWLKFDTKLACLIVRVSLVWLQICAKAMSQTLMLLESDTKEDDMISVTLEEHHGISESLEKEEQEDNTWQEVCRACRKIRRRKDRKKLKEQVREGMRRENSAEKGRNLGVSKEELRDSPLERNTKRRERKRNKNKRPPRPEAIVIKPGEGKTYAEALGEIRKGVNPANASVEIRSIRQTRAGEILLELGPDVKNKGLLRDALKSTLGDGANIRYLEPMITLEVRDLDSYTTEQEVREALIRDLGESVNETKVFVSKTNIREQKMAIVTLNEQKANDLLKASRIKIGWKNCRNEVDWLK